MVTLILHLLSSPCVHNGDLSDFSRADLLDPLGVAADGGQVLVTVLRDQDHILDADAADALVALEHRLVDVLRIAHGREEVR